MPHLPKKCLGGFMRSFFFLSICLFGYFYSAAQTKITEKDILKLTANSDSLVKKYPVEKAYLQFDRTYYSPNDTLWFKAYLLNAASLMFSNKSGLLHIDITKDSGKVVRQYLLPMENGTTWGNIILDDKTFRTGAYILHAYTNWMRNFETEEMFYKSFYITAASENNWLITQKTSLGALSDTNLIDISLHFSNLDKTGLGNKALQLQVLSGNKSLHQQVLHTDKDGMIDINFSMPQKSRGLTILAADKQNNNKAIIPLAVNRPEETDVQFLPEGGNLVAGLPSRVGFKALDEDGKGADISGVVLDHSRQPVTSFKSLHNGIGSFYLNVQAGEIYTAMVTLPGGSTKEYPMPSIKNSGTVLQVKNAMESDSVDVTIAVNDDILKSENDFILVGKSRGITCYAAIVDLHGMAFIRKKIAKRLFPSGITHFILMNSGQQPLNERLIYLDHHDDLQIRLASNDLTYATKDSVVLHLDVTDSKGEPVHGNFSLAITDDARIKTDSLNDINIITRTLLTADLKGYVESPGYYFSKNNKDAWQALDNLMLTQGWVSYEPVSANLIYTAETEYAINGRVTNAFNKPVKGTNVILFSKRPALYMDMVTNNEGVFTFNHFPKVDTPVFLLKAVNKNGRSFNVKINVIELPAPVFITPRMPLQMPWYVNSDTTQLRYVNEDIAYQKAFGNIPDGKHHLKGVIITAKKTIKNSENLNGPGNADLVIDEKELEAAGKKNWLQLFNEKIKGFREAAPGANIAGSYIVVPGLYMSYKIYFKTVIFIVDGILLDSVVDVKHWTDITHYLTLRSTEDIKGIELNYSDKYAGPYKRRFTPPGDPLEYAFIEITTRGGSGPIISNTPGVYLYKPLALSWPRRFYKPRYAAIDTLTNNALRSTIDWEPNIITDEYGKATIWFYTGEKPSTYTIVIEGADYYGNLGYKRQKMVVNGKKAPEKSK